MGLTVRPVRTEEYATVGELTVAAYRSLDTEVDDEGYMDELRDVGRRASAVDVLVAVDDEGRVLGAVTYVGDPTSEFAQHGLPDSASFRHLAVDPAARGHGAGRALVEDCIGRARGAGLRRVVIHSTPWMTTAHRLYAKLGFHRAPSFDWLPVPEVPLWGFELEL